MTTVDKLKYVTCECGRNCFLALVVASQQFVAVCETCGIRCDIASIPFAGLRGAISLGQAEPRKASQP